MSLLFTIVIPTFNRAATICDTIESVVRQLHADCEIIVVDDGSTDGTPERVLDRFGDQVRVILQDNAGPGTARNHGAAEASGRYLAFLDSDDLWFPWTLATYRETLKECRYPGLVTSTPFAFYDARQDLPSDPLPRASARYTDYFASSRTHRNFGSCVLLVRRDIFELSRGFTPARMNGEDLDFVLRIGDASDFVEIASPPLVGWRQHAGNLTGDVAKTAAGLLPIISNERQGKYPGGPPRRRARREIIARHSRSAALAAAAKGNPASAWSLYAKTLAWQVRLGRWRFCIGFPLAALKSLAQSGRPVVDQPMTKPTACEVGR